MSIPGSWEDQAYWALVRERDAAVAARKAAADEIECLRAAIDSRVQECKDMDAEIKRLWAALRDAPCPGGGWNGMPADLYPSIGACVDHKNCGCCLGAALERK